MKLIIQIPCLNEEETLPVTLADLPRELPGVTCVKCAGTDELLETLPRAEIALVWRFRQEWFELAGALRLLGDWGSRHSTRSEPMRHSVCGTPVEARLWCPTCARSLPDDEADRLSFV